MDFNEKILQLARIHPLQPMSVAKALNRDSFTASAMLADLARNGKLKISHLKVGSSPIYYIPGEEAKLQDFIKNLNEKDQRTVLLLSEKKILRDKELDPLTRVSLRQTKDFSIPLEVGIIEQRELFWKWYLLNDDEAEKLIKEILGINEDKKEKKQEIQESVKTQQEKTGENKVKKRFEKQELIQTTENKIQEEFIQVRPKDFNQKINKFFQENKIIIQEQLVKKKNSEFIIQIPSPVGNLNYYCVVKDKKRISESDLTNAYVQSQIKKIPILFVTSGELTKKADELLKQLKGLTFKRI